MLSETIKIPITVSVTLSHFGQFVQNHIKTTPSGYQTKNDKIVKVIFKLIPVPFLACFLPKKKYKIGPRNGRKRVTRIQISLLEESLNSDLRMSTNAINQSTPPKKKTPIVPKNKPPRLAIISGDGVGKIVGVGIIVAATINNHTV